MHARPLDLVVLPLYLGLLGWAAAAGFPRLGALLSPAPSDPDNRLHVALGLLAMGGTLLVWGARARQWLQKDKPAAWGGDFGKQFAKSGAAVVGLHSAILLALLALFAPFIAPFNPEQIDVGPKFTSPNGVYLFGTDDFGRDIFSRCLFGARISLSIGFVAVSLSATLGTLVGACAGYFGGWVDKGLMWFTDLLLALPRLVLLLAIIGIFRSQGAQSLFLIVAVLGATGWMGVARIIRSQILSLKEQEFISAARALGLPTLRILLRHIIPNVLSPVIVFASLAIGSTILTEASLSYLGLGVPPPTPTWGAIVNEGREALRNAPWITLAPGVLIVCAVMSFNLLGDGLRDATDPRLRGRQS